MLLRRKRGRTRGFANWVMTGWESELMGENGKQKAAPWHDLVIDVDICCSLLDQSSDAMPSSPTQAT